jgi:hypothetical protein
MIVKCNSVKYKHLKFNENYEVTYLNNFYISLYGKGGKFDINNFLYLDEKSGKFSPFKTYNPPYRFNYLDTEILIKTQLVKCVNDKNVKSLKKGQIYKLDNLTILFSYDLCINGIFYNLNRFRSLTEEEIKKYHRIEKIKTIL